MYQMQLLNPKVQSFISRVTLDQKVKGSNPSSPATNLSIISRHCGGRRTADALGKVIEKSIG